MPSILTRLPVADRAAADNAPPINSCSGRPSRMACGSLPARAHAVVARLRWPAQRLNALGVLLTARPRRATTRSRRQPPHRAPVLLAERNGRSCRLYSHRARLSCRRVRPAELRPSRPRHNDVRSSRRIRAAFRRANASMTPACALIRRSALARLCDGDGIQDRTIVLQGLLTSLEPKNEHRIAAFGRGGTSASRRSWSTRPRSIASSRRRGSVDLSVRRRTPAFASRVTGCRIGCTLPRPHRCI